MSAWRPEGSIEAVFEAAGIETLPVDVGVELFVDEALAGGKRRVLGCGSLGAMDTFSAFREAPLKLPPGMAGLIAILSASPSSTRWSPSMRRRIVTQTTLSTAAHPFLVDHAIDGVPYHPGVMALEMFAQNALLLKPGTALAGFRDVTFGLPVKIVRESMTVRVEASLSDASDGAYDVQCRLVSDLVSSSGEVFGEREHHTAVVRLVEQAEDLSDFFASELANMPDTGLAPAPGNLLHHPSFIYLRYFHGPRFQSHGGVLRGVQQGEHLGVDGLALMRHQLPVKISSPLRPKVRLCCWKPCRCSSKPASRTPAWSRWSLKASAACRSGSNGPPCFGCPMRVNPSVCARCALERKTVASPCTTWSSSVKRTTRCWPSEVALEGHGSGPRGPRGVHRR